MTKHDTDTTRAHEEDAIRDAEIRDATAAYYETRFPFLAAREGITTAMGAIIGDDKIWRMLVAARQRYERLGQTHQDYEQARENYRTIVPSAADDEAGA